MQALEEEEVAADTVADKADKAAEETVAMAKAEEEKASKRKVAAVVTSRINTALPWNMPS